MLEVVHISQLIAFRKLECEPTTVRGVLRTMSEISAWQLEIEGGEVLRIDAKKISAEDTATLRTGMVIAVEVTVTEEDGPASEGTTKFSAISFRSLVWQYPSGHLSLAASSSLVTMRRTPWRSNSFLNAR